MSSNKVRATGCTRFFIAMIFIIPIAYLVSMYLTGDSVDFKQLLNNLTEDEKTNIEQVEDNKPVKVDKETTTLRENISKKKKEDAKSVKEKVTKELSVSQEDIKKIADYRSKISRLEDELIQKNTQLEVLYKKIEEKEQEKLEVEKKWDQSKLELKEVKEQLSKIKKAIGQ